MWKHYYLFTMNNISLALCEREHLFFFIITTRYLRQVLRDLFEPENARAHLDF